MVPSAINKVQLEKPSSRAEFLPTSRRLLAILEHETRFAERATMGPPFAIVRNVKDWKHFVRWICIP